MIGKRGLTPPARGGYPLAILAVPFATTCVMFAVKKLGGYKAMGNGPEAKPWLRAILVVLALIGTISTAQINGTPVDPNTVSDLIMTFIETWRICRTPSTIRSFAADRCNNLETESPIRALVFLKVCNLPYPHGNRRGKFTFKIDFERGHGDPRRVFEAASMLIDGFEEIDAAVAQSVDQHLTTTVVLEDLQAGSLKVILRTILGDIDDQALKDGEYKKAIGPALVRAKHLAMKALDEPKDHAPEAITNLRTELHDLVSDTDVKHIPAYARVHEGRLVSSLDKLQDASEP